MKRHVCSNCCHAFHTRGSLKRHQSRETGDPPRRLRTPKEWRQDRAVTSGGPRADGDDE